MDIGEVEETIIVEPIESPIPDREVAPSVPAEPERERELVPA
jgi:hypothetical protein